jgi:glycosyltransferase involved in cell wall biosynthesis
MSNNPKVLLLYTELAAYTIACINAVTQKEFEVHLVRWPVNKEAPFEFALNDSVKLYERGDFSTNKLLELTDLINPDVLLVSGWIDKGYLHIVRKRRKSLNIVLILDNPWKGNLKQRLAALAARITITTYFSYCWVPGESQFRFAKALGFKKEKIKKGVYSADLDLFNSLYKNTAPQKQQDFPHRFLYVGRYVDFKGINELFVAFIEFRKSHPDWELWCAGTGELYAERVEAEGIRHFGFLQPEQLNHIIAQTGIFVLPSRKEPWGVVVHEYAAAGFPLICSNRVGAAEAFLVEGENGYYHQPGSSDEIRVAMEKMASKTNEELLTMAHKSHELAQKISPETWAETVVQFLDK